MRKYFCFLLLTIVLHNFSVRSAGAQERKATISGHATDSNQDPLIGARVELQPLGQTATTDGLGQFTIPDVSPGKYVLTVSYLGFDPFSKDVTVGYGAAVNVDAVLEIETVSEEVIVRGERERGEIEALNRERTSDNIVQVLPADVITSLPNTNIADAVGRLPSVSLEPDEGEGKYVQIRGTEPRLSNVTVDGVNLPSPEGNVRNIKLDIIPTGLVDRIEVNKTLSANQDGDAIGGSVNLVTKTPGELPTLDIEGQGRYTNIVGGRWLDAFNATFGQRFGNRKQWGFLLGGTYDWNGRGINDLEPGPGTITSLSGTTYPYFAAADLRTYKYHRTRYGFAPELDYVIKPGSSIYFKGLYSDFHDYGETYVYFPNVGDTLQSVNGPQYTFYTAANCPSGLTCNAGYLNYRESIRRPDQQIFSGLTGGMHGLTSTLITY